ncbi:hypothetical protein [Nocardiopsis oceani]
MVSSEPAKPTRKRLATTLAVRSTGVLILMGVAFYNHVRGEVFPILGVVVVVLGSLTLIPPAIGLVRGDYVSSEDRDHPRDA